MPLGCSSCAERRLIRDQEHCDQNVTPLSVFNYVPTIWRKWESCWIQIIYKLKHGQSIRDIDYGGHQPGAEFTVWLRSLRRGIHVATAAVNIIISSSAVVLQRLQCATGCFRFNKK